jgi:hypothetical protein
LNSKAQPSSLAGTGPARASIGAIGAGSTHEDCPTRTSCARFYRSAGIQAANHLVRAVEDPALTS